MKKLNGFTLVEILVVLTIIGILVALLFPVMARVREKSRAATCVSNLKQIFVASQLYMQDNNEDLPPNAHAIINFADPSAANWKSNIIGSMSPYIKSKQILFCPSVQESTSIYAPTNLSDTSYVGNSVVMGRKLSVVPNASEIVFMHEFPYRTNTFYCNPFWDEEKSQFYINDGYSNAVPDEAFNFPKAVHSDGENVLFCDGHVKWRKSDSFQKEEFGLNSKGSFYHRTPVFENGYDAAF